MSRRGRERGAVTAELAVGLLAVVVALGAVLAAATAGRAVLAVHGAATAGARLLARGEPDAVAVATAARTAGEGAQVRVSRDGPLVRVEVRRSVPLPLPGGASTSVSGSATALAEHAHAPAPVPGVPP